jgi:hypothetical protein
MRVAHYGDDNRIRAYHNVLVMGCLTRDSVEKAAKNIKMPA